MSRSLSHVARCLSPAARSFSHACRSFSRASRSSSHIALRHTSRSLSRTCSTFTAVTLPSGFCAASQTPLLHDVNHLPTQLHFAQGDPLADESAVRGVVLIVPTVTGPDHARFIHEVVRAVTSEQRGTFVCRCFELGGDGSVAGVLFFGPHATDAARRVACLVGDELCRMSHVPYFYYRGAWLSGDEVHRWVAQCGGRLVDVFPPTASSASAHDGVCLVHHGDRDFALQLPSISWSFFTAAEGLPV